MKRVVCGILAIFLLCMVGLTLAGCEGDRIEGTYIAEGGTGERIFVFTEDLIVMFQVINTDTVEFHYTYEIEPGKESGVERLVLTYKGLVYGGNDPQVCYYLDGQREQYARDPVIASELVRGDGYLLINGQKFIRQ